MNRFDRITAILIQLQSKRFLGVQEIAQRFAISHRTVYRDIRSLQRAGVPVVAENGLGYRLMEGYRLPPVMFTKEEALTFVLAEKLMDRFSDQAMIRDYSAAMYKVKAVLRSAEKEVVEQVNDHVAVVKSRVAPDSKRILLQPILRGIAEKRKLRLGYFASHSQEHSQRDVEPVGLVHIGEHWHLIGYCHLRKDYRNFRVDRIASLDLSGEVFEQQHPSLDSFLQKFSKERELSEVNIRVRKDQFRYLEDQKYYMGFVSQKTEGDWIDMRFLTASLEGFARWYLMFGDSAIILKPKVLQKKVRDLALRIAHTIAP